MRHTLIYLLLITLGLSACRKDFFSESAPGPLAFSTDTVIFDTIFSSIGSITHTLKVYNKNDYAVNIEHVGLGKAHSQAVYRINVDGVAGTEAKDVRIAANDSLFIFIEATINPMSGEQLPFLVTDSLVFHSGNHRQDVDLVAYGQNAHFYTPHDNLFLGGEDTVNYRYHSIDEPTTWSNDLPHVVYGYIIIEPGAQLTIEAGAQIHFHKNSGIMVGNPLLATGGGTLKVQGKLGNEVVFQGDRLDDWYEDVAGQWDRIWMTPGSINNEIDYAIIRNGTIGVHADTLGASSAPTLRLSNTIIENMSDIGIFGQGTHIVGYNNLVHNCARYAVVLNIGGQYHFDHCTFANYWNASSRNTPSLLLNNYYEDSKGNLQLRALESAQFTNCIISGSIAGEIELQNNEGTDFNYQFDHCALSIHPDSSLSYLNATNCLEVENEGEVFVDVYEQDYHLAENSPLIDKGIVSLTGVISLDLEGNIRDAMPDIGAYEYQ
jgi:hypothetical protein